MGIGLVVGEGEGTEEWSDEEEGLRSGSVAVDVEGFEEGEFQSTGTVETGQDKGYVDALEQCDPLDVWSEL